MDVHYDAFARHMQRRSFSPRTITEYLDAVRRLAVRFPGKDIAKCSREDLKAFQQWLALKYRTAQGRALSPSSQVRIIAGVSAYFRFLQREGIRFDDPGTVFVQPRAPRRLPRAKVSLDDVMRLLAGGQQSPAAIRDLAAAHLFAVSGLRASELCHLDVEDLDLDRREVCVRHGKGDKDRMTFITESARERLALYLRGARPRLARKPVAALFLGNEGKRWTRHMVYVAIRNLGAACRVNVHPHQLRHLFCTTLLRGGADIRTISELAGHARLSTTARYARVDDDLMQKMYRETHPRGV